MGLIRLPRDSESVRAMAMPDFLVYGWIIGYLEYPRTGFGIEARGQCRIVVVLLFLI